MISGREKTTAASACIDAIDWLRKQIEETATDPLNTVLTTMVRALMSAKVDAVRGAGYGERHHDRANSRNGYRGTPWDTRMLERVYGRQTPEQLAGLMARAKSISIVSATSGSAGSSGPGDSTARPPYRGGQDASAPSTGL